MKPDLFDPAGAFDDFWTRYPRKVGKGQARKAYAKALKVARHADIMHGLSQQLDAMSAKEKQFIPHASTWLNGERWEDEPEDYNNTIGQPATSGGENQGGASGLDEARLRALRAAGRF